MNLREHAAGDSHYIRNEERGEGAKPGVNDCSFGEEEELIMAGGKPGGDLRACRQAIAILRNEQRVDSDRE